MASLSTAASPQVLIFCVEGNLTTSLDLLEYISDPDIATFRLGWADSEGPDGQDGLWRLRLGLVSQQPAPTTLGLATQHHGQTS